MAKYRGQRRVDTLPPHVFAVAEKAYQELVLRRANQSMICCGESGSGKTESTCGPANRAAR
jgi:myosin heavy subunit